MTRTFFGRKKPSRVEITYAAGLFDGEGSIAVVCAGQLAARIQMCDVDPLKRLKRAFGGALYQKIRDGRPNKTAINQLAYQGYEALWFLKTIAVEMRNKKQLKKIQWLLAHWDDYATARTQKQGNKKHRWQMYIDFHIYAQSQGLKSRVKTNHAKGTIEYARKQKKFNKARRTRYANRV